MPNTFYTVLHNTKNPDRLTEYYSSAKTIAEVDDQDDLVGLVCDPRLYRNTSLYGCLINKAEAPEDENTTVFWYYDLLYNEHYLFGTVPPGFAFTSYISLPYGEGGVPEHVPDVDAQSEIYGRYYPYHWTHIEAFDDVFIQGLCIERPTDGGDNLKRNYVNGIPWMETLAGIAGEAFGDQPIQEIAENDILGIAYIPGTDRLDT